MSPLLLGGLFQSGEEGSFAGGGRKESQTEEKSEEKRVRV